MGKESLDIEFKNARLISDVDPADLPDGAVAKGSYNIDLTANGYIQGIHKSSSVGTPTTTKSHGIVRRPFWFATDDGQYHLVYADASTTSSVSMITDFYGTPTWDDVPSTVSTQTSGTLTVGWTYRIVTFVAGDDFTNVGGVNASGTTFTATGTTPTTWTNSSVLSTPGLGPYSAIQKGQEMYLGLGPGSYPKMIHYEKDQILAYTSIVTETGVNNFIIDSSQSTGTSVDRIQIVAGATSGSLLDITTATLSNGSGLYGSKLEVTSTGSFTGLSTGDMIYCSLSIDNWDTDRGYEIDGNIEVLNKVSNDVIDLDIDYDALNEHITGDIDMTTAATATWKYANTPFSSWSATKDIKPGKWVDINNGVKIKFLTDTGWVASDAWDIHYWAKDTSPDLYIEGTQLTTMEHTFDTDDVSITVDFDGDGDNFTPSKYYTFGYSMLYSNEESPIHSFEPIQTASGAVTATLTVSLDMATSIRNKRWTGICIYGASGDTPDERNLFRLIKEIDFNVAKWDLSSGTYTWHDPTHTPDIILDMTIETQGGWSETYESRTGIVDNMESTIVNYMYSVELNGSLFVANATREDLEDNLFLFRSEPYAYSTFNWKDNLLRLPKLPIALASFAGKIWAFTDNEIYKINYDLYIEDTVEGIGCIDNECVTVTEYGMFWADRNGVYHHNGRNIEKIDGDINELIKSEHISTGIKGVTFCGQENLLLVHLDDWAYAYHIGKKAWMDDWLWNTTDSNTHYTAFSGKNGEVYLSTLNTTDSKYYLRKTFDTTAGRDFAYVVTKVYSFGEVGEKAKIYECNIDGSNDLWIFRHYIDNRASTPQTNLSGGITVAAPSPYSFNKAKGKLLQLELVTQEDELLYTASVIYRRFIGKYG